MSWWEGVSGKIEVGMARVDEKGRVLIPLEERLKAGLRPGVERSFHPARAGCCADARVLDYDAPVGL